MKERKNNSVIANNTEKKYIIFKRCNRASGFLHLPHIDQRLQYTSFTEGIGLKLEPGDIVNTPKQNQLLVVHTSDCDPSTLFDIEKSSFEIRNILTENNNILEYLDKVVIPERTIAGTKCYVINKRKFTFIDIKDAVHSLNCLDSLEEQIILDEEKKVYLPTYFYNLLGSLKAELFDELVEN